MHVIEVTKSKNNFVFNDVCTYVFSKNRSIKILKSYSKAKKIVDNLRQTPSCIDGNVIDQYEYCYGLMKALYEGYINDIDEFVDLYLKICIACDYKTKVFTTNILPNSIIEDAAFNSFIENQCINQQAYKQITFYLQKQDLDRDRIVLYELFKNNRDTIPTQGSNIPLSDYKYVDNNLYRIRIASIYLIKLYLQFYYWLPNFYYRFGISSKCDINKGLKDPDNLGRDINLWCPDPVVKNYNKVHGYKANTSLTTLHDLIHLNILASYPKYFPLLISENVRRIKNAFSEDIDWNNCLLAWRLIDFSVANNAPKNNINDLNFLFYFYIVNVCKPWMEQINKQLSFKKKRKLFLILFKELIILVKKNTLWGFNGQKIINYLGFDLDDL